jgi:hypothetical protein
MLRYVCGPGTCVCFVRLKYWRVFRAAGYSSTESRGWPNHTVSIVMKTRVCSSLHQFILPFKHFIIPHVGKKRVRATLVVFGPRHVG